MKFHYIFVLILVSLFVFGCTGLLAKDCGANTNCFQKELRECNSAKFSALSPTLMGTFQVDYLIKGLDNNSCVVHYTVAGGESGKAIGETDYYIPDYGNCDFTGFALIEKCTKLNDVEPGSLIVK